MGALKLMQEVLGFCRPAKTATVADVAAEIEDGVISRGDFRIDVAARTASVCGKKLDLTAAEFDLLVYLVKRPKRVITPHTLLTTKWEDDRVLRVEFLRVLVSLRKKLEIETPSSQYIRIEPWIIYRFDPHGAR
jgi:DNA-binding response OmpR family regulator